jgi:hypothetical protein
MGLQPRRRDRRRGRLLSDRQIGNRWASPCRNRDLPFGCYKKSMAARMIIVTIAAKRAGPPVSRCMRSAASALGRR